MILLENEHMKATFHMKGAELKSLVNKDTGLEYLWDGNPDFWSKSSPVLFPIVGALRENTYTYNGNTYPMSRHGFARDLDFNANQLSATAICFTLHSNPELKSVYPFDFQLDIRYELKDSGLRCTYEVYNPGEVNLLFSLGAHPAFKVPLTPDTTYEEYYLKFNKDTILQFHKIIGNLIDDRVEELPLEEGELSLSHGLFIDDALVFKSLESDEIELRNHRNNHGLRFQFQGFPYFGIWSATNANFVCLEPWCGIADGIGHDQSLDRKEGIVQLSPQAHWKKEWSVSCF